MAKWKSIQVWKSLIQKKLKEVLQEMDSKESETVIIGDLFITDISVGNKLGLYTILINPYTHGLESKFKKNLLQVFKVCI